MKIRLTENQYNRLKGRLLEFTQKETNEIFVVGNIVTFHIKDEAGTHAIKIAIVKNPKSDKETPNVFYGKVLSDYPANLKGCYLEINQPGQNIANNFTVLNLGKVNQNNDLTRNPVKYTFNNIFKVDVRDNTNKLLGSYFAQEHNQEKQPDNKNNRTLKRKNDFINMLNELNENETIKFHTPEGNVALTLMNKQGDLLQFEIEKPILTGKYSALRKFSSMELSNNIDKVSYDVQTKGLNIPFKGYWNEDGEMFNELGVINGITDWELIDEVGDDEEEQPQRRPSEQAKEVMDAIINDPLMKKAFYSQPTLWNLITSAVKGENPRGTGITPAMEIIKKYNKVKIEQELGANASNFIPNISSRFKIIDQNVFSNPTGKQIDKLDLKVGDTYKAIYRERLDATHIILNCGLIKAQIIINSAIPGLEDSYNVTFVKEIEGKNGVSTKKTDGKIQFISAMGSGYYNPEKDNKEKQKTNTPPINK